MKDFLIIGGGVVGSFIARELTKYDVSVILVEKEGDLAQVQTTHNSALIHSPVAIPPEKGALKARLAKEGNAMHREIAPALGVPILMNGAYMIAFDEKEMATLIDIEKASESRGVEAVRILDRDTALANEPNLNPDLFGVLEMPTAMTADTYILTTRIAMNAEKNGASIHTDTEVLSIATEDGHFMVHTTNGDFTARHVINAAGVKNADIAAMVESDVPYAMRPHRGEYYVLGSKASAMTHHTLFPVPKDHTKGILAIPQPDGSLRLGPTSTPQDDPDRSVVSSEGLTSVRAGVDKLIPGVPFDKAKRTYAGLRSTIDREDFYIARSHEHETFIHVAGIDSPGITAAPAIARYVAEEILDAKHAFKVNPDFDPFLI